MNRWKETTDLLNQYALTLPGAELSFRVHYWGVDLQHYNTPIHKHSFFEVCYVRDGSGDYDELGTGLVYPLRKGTFFCSRPGVVHQIRSSFGLDLLYVAFEVNEAHSALDAVERFRKLASLAEVCVADASDHQAVALWTALLLPDQESNQLSTSYMQPIAHVLLSAFADLFSPRVPQTQMRRARPSDYLLRRAKLFIRDNLDRPITLEQVADYLHLSKRHVSRIFSEGIHESFNHFVRKERVQSAAYMLKHTSVPIKTIAEETGFGTVHSFTRAFSQEFGISPARYRSSMS
jgi:AraC-like DNA-binding protein/mannose-6-phosphate isomerase-like protein (cupin superfamily)